ncbi:branched-subunit amino acid aminotransferase/4-amino-4-deoxychorismate lyase [Kitasatospora gansuensis]|uniref:Branched-subunit amino acid aminotransferase/4-amino-4-deoxychorismate lyase n=1 Tax=Kitasatospora gansuensis TaxID=258050 RepID=A0A7W7SGW5_9ACTN|nr:aminotransferase class IV [Kitasatospora gansuensis]MBB4950239.1 branched-subunit amino acid aminotransferase/4-amino-4-deoxychorismate lyase [Kitasatospora gansuensis]
MAELNGRPVRPAELQALALTNYGHFTTMRVTDGRVRGLALHLERLRRDCRALFGTELDLDLVRSYARRAVPGSGSTMLRLTVFDPALDLGSLGGRADPAVLVTTRPAGDGAMPPPLRVRSVGYVRDQPEVKSVGLFGALRHRRAAQLAGYDDALFVDGTGAVSEGGTWNLGLIRDGEPVWPEAAYLPGTTLELLRGLRPGRSERVPLTGLSGFQAAFAGNAAIGVRPIAAVDGVELDPGHPLIAELAAAYRDLPGTSV